MARIEHETRGRITALGIWEALPVLPQQEASIQLPDGARMDCLRLGSGAIPLVVVPGAGDGQFTASQARWRLRLYFVRRWTHYSMVYLSRREPLPPNWSMTQHAADYAAALDQLDWGPAIWECNSAGGPIGQVVAVTRPELVQGLVLSCSFHRTDDHLRRVLRHWIDLARRGDWTALHRDSIARTFRPRMVRRYQWLRPLLGLIARPRCAERFIRVLTGLLNVDHRSILPRIERPTLVIGGADDQVISREIQLEMGQLIPESRTMLYSGYGHGNDQENPDYQRQLVRFANEVAAA